MYQVPKNTTAARAPHSMVGALSSDSPERPALARTLTVVGCGGGASNAGPISLETTIKRWAALNRGAQVVSVSRLSGAGSRTATSEGPTSIEWSSLYWTL